MNTKQNQQGATAEVKDQEENAKVESDNPKNCTRRIELKIVDISLKGNQKNELLLSDKPFFREFLVDLDINKLKTLRKVGGIEILNENLCKTSAASLYQYVHDKENEWKWTRIDLMDMILDNYIKKGTKDIDPVIDYILEKINESKEHLKYVNEKQRIREEQEAAEKKKKTDARELLSEEINNFESKIKNLESKIKNLESKINESEEETLKKYYESGDEFEIEDTCTRTLKVVAEEEEY